MKLPRTHKTDTFYKRICFSIVLVVYKIAFDLTKWASNKMLNKYGYSSKYLTETYEYFERQSKVHKNWWHYKKWWKPNTTNPIYEYEATSTSEKDSE